jgi:hypothetical protein
MPNRGGRGYYRWHLDETRLDRLTQVMTSGLDAGERLAVADSITAGVEAGTANLAAFFGRLPQVLKSGERYRLMSPIGVWRQVQLHTLDDAGRSVSRARLRALYGPVLGELEKHGSTSDEERLTRARLMGVLAFDGLDPTLRAERRTGACIHRFRNRRSCAATTSTRIRRHRCGLRRRMPIRVLRPTW